MNTQPRKDILTLIMADMKCDAATLDGQPQPFNGYITAQVFDRLMGAIAALAAVVASSEDELANLKEALAKLKEDGTLKCEPKGIEMGCFWGLNPGERPGACALSCIFAPTRKKTGECDYWRPISEWKDNQAES